MYSRDQIEQVRSKVDITELIRSYVPSLTVSGRHVKGLCPFHKEKTASFNVQPEKGFFKCFGCGESGDAISFLSKIENVSFTESLEKLAVQVGVALRKEKSQTFQPTEGVTEKLYRVLEAAALHYESQLADEAQGLSARTYLEKRGFTSETQQKFRLGLAASGGDAAFEVLLKKGFSIELCQQAGLVARSASGKYYDPLFARLIFPIVDTFGRVVGFGGRILANDKKSFFGDEEKVDSGPKYINSPESPVFSKGKMVYGLPQAKAPMLSTRRAMIMEGYTDVIGVNQGGFPNAVATLGTAFTHDHAKLLKRYCDEVILFFDPDEAGERATLKSLAPLLKEGLFPRIVQPTSALDPDEIAINEGPEAFQRLIDSAPDFVDHFLARAVSNGAMGLEKKMAVAQQLLTMVANSPNDVLKGEWIERIALRLGLSSQSLMAESKKKKPDAGLTNELPSLRPKQSAVTMPSAEEEYLQLYYRVSSFESETELDETFFTSERMRQVFNLMKNQKSESGKVSLTSICDQLAEADRGWFMELFLEEKAFEDPQDRLRKLNGDLRLNRDRGELLELSHVIKSGTAPEDVQVKYQQLLRRVKGSK